MLLSVSHTVTQHVNNRTCHMLTVQFSMFHWKSLRHQIVRH